MKLDPLFYVKENNLYKISDNSAVDIQSMKKIQIKWSEIELEPESYNEEYLANLRDELKKFDDLNQFAILIPVVDKELKSEEDQELFINAYNHTARRIKDCVSVAGYELPAELLGDSNFTQNFIDTLAKKHAQYIYFASKSDAEKNIQLNDSQLSSIVMY